MAVETEPEDVVIDAGGCWGDTALYFAARVGPRGKVICFEFVEGNLKIYQENMRLNPELERRVTLLEKAVWDRSCQILGFADDGPATKVGQNIGWSYQVHTKSIDDLVSEMHIKRVDLVKMDIEGAELKGLKGAEQTIRKFRPKLMIAVYHNLEDFIEIPQWIDGLGVGYELYIDHFSIRLGETILFARPKY